MIGLLLVSMSVAQAQQTYPRVYGPTGHAYGPTQAHYQYERQYGQPWHGYRGIPGNVPGGHVHFNVPYYGYGVSGGFPYSYLPVVPYATVPYGPYGIYSGPAVFGGYGGYGAYGYGLNGIGRIVTQRPVIINIPPPSGNNIVGSHIVGSNSATYGPGVSLPYADHTLARDDLANARVRGQQPNVADPLADDLQRLNAMLQPKSNENAPIRPIQEASHAAKLKSNEFQNLGDLSMRRQDWQQALVNYSRAVDAADDRAEAHFRLGVVYSMLRHYGKGVDCFRRAVHVDPKLPQSELTLGLLFGPDASLARSSLLRKATEYASENLKDPDRLFLLGVLVHFDGDLRSRDLFAAAEKFGGPLPHVSVFLHPRRDPVSNPIQRGEPVIDNQGVPPTPLPEAPIPDRPFLRPDGRLGPALDSKPKPPALQGPINPREPPGI